MLWLCIIPARLSLEALDPLGLCPGLVVVSARGARRRVVDTRLSLPAGDEMDCALSMAGCVPSARNPSVELAALKQLAYAAYGLGSPVHLTLDEPQDAGQRPDAAVWVEVEASLALFGGIDAVVTHTRHLVASSALTCQIGVAPTVEAARMGAMDQACLPTQEALERWLPGRSLGHLRLPARVRTVLRGSGLATIGDLLRIPASAVARRFGPEVADYLGRLVGRLPDVRAAVVPPAVFERTFEFFTPVTSTDGLLMPLRGLLVDLSHYLRSRDAGLTSLRVELDQERGGTHVVDIGLAASTRDATHLAQVARQRFERVELRDGVVALRVTADEFTAPESVQGDLFNDRARVDQDWRRLIERVAARWGEKAVWSPAVGSDHRPELATVAVAPGHRAAAVPLSPPRPMWLVDPPRRIAPIVPASAPERVHVGWWSTTAVERDYFSVQLGGQQAWVFRERQTGQWYLQGLWA